MKIVVDPEIMLQPVRTIKVKVVTQPRVKRMVSVKVDGPAQDPQLKGRR